MTEIVRRTGAPLRAATVIAVSLMLLFGSASGPGAAGTSAAPSLRLLRTDPLVIAEHGPGDPVMLDIGTYVGAVGGPFDLRVRRTAQGFDIRQVVPTSTGVKEVRKLPGNIVGTNGEGLAGFFQLTARDPGGRIAGSTTAPFCPAGWGRARLDDSGSDRSIYPWVGCWFTEVSRALVWGIESGWAAVGPDPWMTQIDLPDGDYALTVEIAKRYRTLFAIADADARTSITLRVVTGEGWGHPELRARHRHPEDLRNRNNSPAVPGDASGMPDLIALPAHAIVAHQDEETGRDVIVFGATVWNGGMGPLVVEGFRRQGEMLMDAYQYFYTDGVKTGRSLVGTFEYDDRDGHSHWHFTDFAQYRLTSLTGAQVLRSTKEAFCLVPTDAVDLTVPTANWQPNSFGLTTSCGGLRSLWLRQILDVGWGDTYHQWLPGQSFDITGVPNGDYLIRVSTNDDRRLKETDYSNNVATVRISIGGVPGARTVTVR